MYKWEDVFSRPPPKRTVREKVRRAWKSVCSEVRRYWNFHLRDPKNVVRIPTLERGNWIDADLRLIHAAFALLAEYVEDEQGGAQVYQAYIDELSAESCSGQVEAEKELLFLYLWWKDRDHSDWEGMVDRKYNENTDMLVRLCRARGAMWT